MARHGYLHDEYDRDFTGEDDRERWRDRDDDREFMFDRAERGDRDRNFTFEDRERERTDKNEWFGGRSDWERRPRSFRSRVDDHYRSWRDKQIQALDRDYAEYCREREHQFHSDFDAWRSQRRGTQGPLRTGMTQTAQTGDLTGETDSAGEAGGTLDLSDPMANATAGTNTSEMTGTGKSRRS